MEWAVGLVMLVLMGGGGGCLEVEAATVSARGHWAFRVPLRPVVPGWEAVGAGGAVNPVDAFIEAERRRQGLKAQPEAPREVLVRRLYLDLVGVPPTLEELKGAIRSVSAGWYEELVERLLADPRHGERWGRHWMDIWRYSDWWGLGDQLRNSQKHIWHWRDWIIESLNRDEPYDRMVRLMLAADELEPRDLASLRATGFLARNWFLFNRNQWMEETVEHVGKAFLGLTLNCAKCHEHKYDPIEQTDFYRMRAFFEPYHVRLDAVPGEVDLGRDGIPRVYDGELGVPTYRFIRGMESQPDTSAAMVPGVPEFFPFRELNIRPVALPAEAFESARRGWVLEDHLRAARRKLMMAEERWQKAQRGNGGVNPEVGTELESLKVAVARAELESVERRVAATKAMWAWKDSGMKDGALRKTAEQARETAVRAERSVAVALGRLGVAEGEAKLRAADPGRRESVEGELKKARTKLEEATQRMALPVKADERYMGLDGARWTATRFKNSSADDPEVRFGPVSTGRRKALAEWMTDRRNPLTARVAVNHVWARHFGEPLVGTVFDFGAKGARPTHPELLDWLAVEFMDRGWSLKHLHRLMVTSATYRMTSSVVGGESSMAKDPDNTRWWRRGSVRVESEVVRDSLLALSGQLETTMGGASVGSAEQAESRRRSVYFFHSNNERNLLLTTFDGAMVKECYRRDQSIVPQQALALSNAKLVRDSAEAIARRLSADDVREERFVRDAFGLVLGMVPGEEEVRASVEALGEWGRQFSGEAGGKIRARSQLIWTLLNHHDFVTVR